VFIKLQVIQRPYGSELSYSLSSFFPVGLYSLTCILVLIQLIHLPTKHASEIFFNASLNNNFFA